MRILVFGLSVTSSWGNGHATLWRGLLRSLVDLGHEVAFFERDVAYYAAHRDIQAIPSVELVLYPAWKNLRSELQGYLGNADVAIVTSYCPDALDLEPLLLRSSVTRVFYDLDSPVTLERLENGEAVPYVGDHGYATYHLVLSYAGGPFLQRLQFRMKARRVAPLYGSVDPRVHHRVPADPQYQADLSYLGTYAPDRQPSLERLFLKPARLHPRARFVIGGAMYPPDFPWLENIRFAGHVAPEQHRAFYSSARLNLNITRAAMLQAGFAPSGRLFEAAACAAPVLSDRWPGIEEFFDPGSEVLLASSPEEVIEVLEYPAERVSAVGEAARRRVLRSHTAAHRAQELIHYIDQASNLPTMNLPEVQSCGESSLPPA